MLNLSAYADSPAVACQTQIPYGMPVNKSTNHVDLCKTAYMTEVDLNAKIPVWVSYVLTAEHAVGCVKRSNAFSPDPELPRGSRAELKDYAKSGYDIGHQANDGDMSWDVQVERESFLLSNMAPQLPGFNRGIWKKLEDQTRGWALTRNDPLLIYVGPIYNSGDKTIGPNKVVVPHGFYKIIIDTYTSEVMAFRFNHEASQGNLNLYLTTVDQLQQETGIVFPLPARPFFSKKIWPADTKNAKVAKRSACK